MDAKLWHSLPENEGLDTVKHIRSNRLQVSDVTEKERWVTTSYLLTEQGSDTTCTEGGNTENKP